MPPKLAAKLAGAVGNSIGEADSLKDGRTLSAKDMAASKRQKKREVDRRCQREARQRTKARIAHLEALVEDLRQQDTSGQVANLMKQVAEVRKERDLFARTLRSIEDSICGHRELLGSTHAGRDLPGDNIAQEKSQEPADKLPKASIATVDWALSSTIANADCSSSLNVAPSIGTSLTHSEALLTAMPTQICPDLVIPPRDEPCPYCDDIENSGTRPQSIWRFANEVLSARPRLSAAELRFESQHSKDTPVRAVLEGWNATEQRLGGTLPPLWKDLRRIDERVFFVMPPVERLAILHIMYLLYRNHADPATQQAEVPSWYLARPSQNLEHAYAIDFFCWPGIRERFIFSEHSYCTDLFWHLLTKSLRIIWQFDFRDCYTFNRLTGTYCISPSFEQRISDIKVWAMGPAFFSEWPELQADIPSFEGSALSMDRIIGPGGFKSALQADKTKEDSESRHGSRVAARVPTHRSGQPIDQLSHSTILEMFADNFLESTQAFNGVGAGYDNDGKTGDNRSNRPMQLGDCGDTFHEVRNATDMPPKPSMPSLAELSQNRGVELLPRHDWLWLTRGLAETPPDSPSGVL